LKILILYTYNQGLLSEFFQELSERLCSDDFEVVNFYLKHKKDFFVQNKVRIYGEKRGHFTHNYKAIYQIIKKTKPDVVISNFSYINPAILFGKLLGVRQNIAWFHTAYGHTKPSWLKVFNKSIYLNMADVVLTNSTSLQKEMHGVYKVAIPKTRCVPFWTNISRHRTDSDPLKMVKDTSILNIGCPGRLVADKNQALVLQAIHKLKQTKGQTLRLYIAGSGPHQAPLEQLVEDLDLGQEVVFLGLLNVKEMTSFYEAMDVVVLPSFHEAFGLVFIEAIAMGTPVLVSNTFGALDFIDEKKFPLEDFSFDPHDIQELIDKLEPYLNYRGLSADYFKRLHEATFDKEVIYNQVKSVILNQNIPS